MGISLELIKELRERTSAGINDCKKALAETNGDIDKAADFLREKGLAAAAKKAGRIASEGIVESYIHAGGRIGDEWIIAKDTWVTVVWAANKGELPKTGV